MKKKPSLLLVVIALNLVVLVALAFFFPHLMVSPGPLVKGHAELTTDCFACHAPWRGAAAMRCIECHAVADIGLKTTKGVPIPPGIVRSALDGVPTVRSTDKNGSAVDAVNARAASASASMPGGATAAAVASTSAIKASFHQGLREQDCMACHSDHQGPKLTKRSRKPFSHALLQPAIQRGCAACHGAPADTVHRDLRAECSTCHTDTAWKPATFDHALLAKPVLERCEGCHAAPTDRLHRQLSGGCASCHETKAWKPATFDHAKHFVLDRDHDVACDTCHKNNDFSRYTCYGCHEHSQAKIRAEHLEEGIRDFANCVECHRDPRAEPKRPDGRARGARERD